MNFEKAHRELMDCKKIRRKEWEQFMHLRIIDGEVKTFKGEYSDFYQDSNILISNGWLVMEGDGKEIPFLEALEHLREKKWITKRTWLDAGLNRFVFVDNGKLAICNEVQFEFMPTWKCLCATDWEVMK
jgi:hypothetical protein